jgi:hypothetical protein
VTDGFAKLPRRLQLPFGAVSHQAQVHVAVGARFAPGVRAEQDDPPQRQGGVHRFQAQPQHLTLRGERAFFSPRFRRRFPLRVTSEIMSMNITFRLAAGGLLAGALFLTACSSTSGSRAAGQVFNGRDLNGWTCRLAKPDVPMDAVWSVRDGLLICKGEPLGYLATTREFTNVRVVAEWRWAPGTKPGNSGVLLRINGEPRALPRCLEAQLQSGNAGDLLGLHGMGISGDPTRVRKIAGHELAGDITIVGKKAALENPPGEWNRYEIELRGGSFKAWVNGTLANEATDCEVVAGPVGFQSEGGEIHFRKLEVTALQ